MCRMSILLHVIVAIKEGGDAPHVQKVGWGGKRPPCPPAPTPLCIMVRLQKSAKLIPPNTALFVCIAYAIGSGHGKF